MSEERESISASNHFSLLLRQPDVLLALSLSAPAKTSLAEEGRRFTVEVTHDEFVVRTPVLAPRPIQQTALFCTKETICIAVLLYTLWKQRGAEFEPQLVNRITGYARELAHLTLAQEDNLNLFSMLSPQPVPMLHGMIQSLDVSDQLIVDVQNRCVDIFRILESEGLAIDPGFIPSPEMVFLLGLVPLHFSVRTPEGENVYRRIKLNAPLWSLEIDRIKEGRKIRNDIQLDIRGVGFIRGVLKRLAEQYLASEQEGRLSAGKPTLPPPSAITLDKTDGR